MSNALANVNSQDISGLLSFYSGIGHSITPIWAFTSSFLILIILVLFFIGFGRFMGYGPFVGLIAALYISYALYTAFPYMSYLPSAPITTAIAAHLALYLAFFVVNYLLMRKVAASDFVHMGTIGVIIVSFAVSGFIMTLAYQSFAIQTIYHFTPQLDQLFATPDWFFLWFVAPIASLIVFAKSR